MPRKRLTVVLLAALAAGAVAAGIAVAGKGNGNNKTFRDQTIAFKKPVVLVHGDSHYFMVDKPLLDSSGRRVENFTRVETFGDHGFAAHPQWDTNDVNWVKALVDRRAATSSRSRHRSSPTTAS